MLNSVMGAFMQLVRVGCRRRRTFGLQHLCTDLDKLSRGAWIRRMARQYIGQAYSSGTASSPRICIGCRKAGCIPP